MNKTNFEHALGAVIMQLLLGYFIGYDNAAYVAIAFYSGREYSQAEFKVRSKTGISLTGMQPWHVLKKEYWSLDAILDVAVPVFFLWVVYLITLYF